MLFWALFLWWQVFPIFVAGFGASFEFKNLLRFPLSLRAFYLLGLGYGFADFAAFLGCWILSMLVAALASRPGVVPVLLLVSALFIVLNVTMERLVGSWLEKVMARRKSREIFVGMFILSMASLNFLNPGLHRWGGGSGAEIHSTLGVPVVDTSLAAAGNAVGGAVHGDLRGFLLGSAGLLGRDWNHERILVEAIPSQIWRRAGRKRRAGSGKEKAIAAGSFE